MAGRGTAGSPIATITGISELAPQARTDSTAFELMGTVARTAMLDAGLLPPDIDGLLVAPPMQGAPLTLPAMAAEYLGLQPTYADVVDLGGASAAAMVWRAAAAINIGACRNVLCVLVESRGPWSPPHRATLPGAPTAAFEAPYGRAGPTTGYALAADLHRHRYGTTDEQRAAVVVAQRANAVDNALAAHRTAIDVDDVLNSPMVSDPLHLLEIVRSMAGGAAFIVSAPGHESPHDGVDVLGFAERTSHHGIAQMPHLDHTATADTAARAMSMAGVTPDDIDVAELYDCYTITVLLTLEDAGFCPKGESGAYVVDNGFGLTSPLPVNTNGGQLAMGQAGLAGGATHLVQAARQLRRGAGALQVSECTTAFVHGNGGVFGEQCSLVLGRNPR